MPVPPVSQVSVGAMSCRPDQTLEKRLPEESTAKTNLAGDNPAETTLAGDTPVSPESQVTNFPTDNLGLAPVITAEDLSKALLRKTLNRLKCLRMDLVAAVTDATADREAVHVLIMGSRRQTNEQINTVEMRLHMVENRLDMLDQRTLDTNKRVETLEMNLQELADALLQQLPSHPCRCCSCGEAVGDDAAKQSAAPDASISESPTGELSASPDAISSDIPAQ